MSLLLHLTFGAKVEGSGSSAHVEGLANFGTRKDGMLELTELTGAREDAEEVHLFL